jgi:hypothetical protein
MDDHKVARENSTRVHSNMFGFRGVEWRQDRGKFRARIEPTPGKRGRWLGTFDTAEEAARAYDAAARAEYGDAAYLNFPAPGEKSVIASMSRVERRCPHGHDLDKQGYSRPDGRGVTCRACNNAAARRSYTRRQTRIAEAAGIPVIRVE